MLTTKQKQVLEFIKNFRENYGYIPTLKIIADELGMRSASTIHEHIQKLVDKGYLVQECNYGNIELAKSNYQDTTVTPVPMLGFIAAGQPIDVLEDTKPELISVTDLPNSYKFYALTVRGDSMIDEGIYDGDIVIIKEQNSAENGQTVVAITDDEKATLKRIYKVSNGYELRPSNQNLQIQFYNEVEVRGVVWEIKRNFNNYLSEKPVKTWKTLDLFAGIGGIRLGFERAGFKTVFANDFEKACKSTYDLNFNDAKLVVEDITKIKTADLPEFDFLLGGFPCQAFSIAGYRQGFKDEKGRGNLFFDIARIIEDRQPEGFLLENVKNLKSHDGGKTFKVIEKTLNDLGYSIKAKVLNSMEYGNVPQNRERIYIVGFKDHAKTEAFEFPEPKELTKTVLDILEKDVDSKYYYTGKPLHEHLENEVTELGAVYQWRRKYVRKNKKGVCPTLTANMGMGGHNVPIIFDGKGIRKLTPRECARLQGFPDTYKLPNLADSVLYKQLGNSVTVSVLERIAMNMQAVI